MKKKINQQEVGVYPKYIVKRADETDLTGGKHYNCFYFVLDLDCDPHAIPAIKAYIDSCKTKYPLLARDLEKLIKNKDTWKCPACGKLIELNQITYCEACATPDE